MHDLRLLVTDMFPVVGVVGPQVIHVCDIPGPEGLVLEYVHRKENLSQTFSNSKMEQEISIPLCCHKEKDRLHSM